VCACVYIFIYIYIYIYVNIKYVDLQARVVEMVRNRGAQVSNLLYDMCVRVCVYIYI